MKPWLAKHQYLIAALAVLVVGFVVYCLLVSEVGAQYDAFGVPVSQFSHSQHERRK
jgi:ABC-type uncharacterized transport system permease subunit